MSEQKFTPGPWTLNRHGAIVGGEFHQFTNGSAQSQLAMAVGGNGFGDEERKANGRLIAAAPELLEELEAIYTWLGDYTHEWPGRSTLEGQGRLVRMREVIAKATGRSGQDVQDDYGTRAAMAKATGAQS